MSLRRWIIVPVLLSGTVLSGCSNGNKHDSTVAGSTPPASTAPAADGDVVVHIKNFAYSPSSFTLKKGHKITFINDDSSTHTSTLVSGAPEAFDSGNLAKGDSKTFTPATAGTYNYICSIHQYMKASFTVA